jgi:hypothetical protein
MLIPNVIYSVKCLDPMLSPIAICLVNIFQNGIVQSVIGAYFFLIAVKMIALLRIIKFKGKYTHFRPEDEKIDKVVFTVSLNVLEVLVPIPNMTIKIIRKDEQNPNSHYWDGAFHSDILNPLHFKGNYLIKGQEYGPERTGWHEIYFFNDSPLKIAFKLHYIRGRNWITDEGYYIYKNEI